jgi:hypothetical protein
MRWISDVPSKMVKIVDYGAVSAGQRPAVSSGISTDSARPVRVVRFPHRLQHVPAEDCGGGARTPRPRASALSHDRARVRVTTWSISSASTLRSAPRILSMHLVGLGIPRSAEEGLALQRPALGTERSSVVEPALRGRVARVEHHCLAAYGPELLERTTHWVNPEAALFPDLSSVRRNVRDQGEALKHPRPGPVVPLQAELARIGEAPLSRALTTCLCTIFCSGPKHTTFKRTMRSLSGTRRTGNVIQLPVLSCCRIDNARSPYLHVAVAPDARSSRKSSTWSLPSPVTRRTAGRSPAGHECR